MTGALLKPVPMRMLPAAVVTYDVSAMADDPEFLRAAHRLAEYQVYYQIWHLQMRQAADKVLSLL